MWAPVVARQILHSKPYSSSCHVFIRCYKLNCFNDTLSQISQISNFSPVHNALKKPHAKKANGVKSGDLGGQTVGPSAYNTSHADKHVARA